MDIDEKTLKELIEDKRVLAYQLQVMDSGMNLSLILTIAGAGRAVLHTKRGGVRVMSPQAALKFAREVLGEDEIKVVLKNERK